MEFTQKDCSDMIATWVEKASSPDAIEEIAKEARYKNNPLYGAKKKRIKLMSEICLINTAIAIHSVNSSFEQINLKPIIDGFLQILQKSMFGILEKNMNGFGELYESRMAEYFQIFHEEQPGLTLALVFLKNLHGKTILELQSQTVLAVRFSKSMSTSIDAMQRMAKYV